MSYEFQTTETGTTQQQETVENVRQGERKKGMPSVLAISTLAVIAIFAAMLAATIA